MAPDTVIARCLDEGIDVLAVTDHNEIRGALELAARAPFRVIVGEEIRTAEGGEIIGLFLREKIAARTPARDVVAAIRAQGGLVYLPHAFDPVRGKPWPAELRDELLRTTDIVEVFNARSLWPAADRRAVAAARQYGKVPCAGADAHLPSELGPTVVWLTAWDTPAALRESLRAARFTCVRNSPMLRAQQLWAALSR